MGGGGRGGRAVREICINIMLILRVDGQKQDSKAVDSSNLIKAGSAAIFPHSKNLFIFLHKGKEDDVHSNSAVVSMVCLVHAASFPSQRIEMLQTEWYASCE